MVRVVAAVTVAVLVVAVAAGCASGRSGRSSKSDAATPTVGASRTSPRTGNGDRIVFLHHSTGEAVWSGGVRDWFSDYNAANGTHYEITERVFPKDSPYGWNNYPYDYWNIWVDHAGQRSYKGEPTLEQLSAQYGVIVWKHCFPVSNVRPDTGSPDVRTAERRQEHYRVQYLALRDKMRTFPETRFVVWTSAALIESETDPAEALRSKSFVDWVRGTWDEPGDNIFVWDFWQLETEGGLYLSAGNSAGSDSHPGKAFAKRVAPLFAQRVVDVIEGRGDA